MPGEAMAANAVVGDAMADVQARAAWHRALADEHRLRIVDALELSDRSSVELAVETGLASNLLAFHLGVLEEVGLVARHRSRGDARRRYVTLGPSADALTGLGQPRSSIRADRVLFVCTHNAARSQLAAGMWTARTGRPSWSAGARPTAQVHPEAVRVARRHGVELAGRPSGYSGVEVTPDLVVSVCDRAREGQPPFDAPLLHWSIAEPEAPDDFSAAWDELDRRMDRLVRRSVAA